MQAVILLQPHEDAGITHPAGACLTLPAPDADWLIERGIAGIDPAPAPAKAKPAKAKQPDAH